MKLIPVIGTLSLLVYVQSTHGQSVSVSVPAQGMDVQVLAVPASTAATYLNVTVDASPNGGGTGAQCTTGKGVLGAIRDIQPVN
jgi:hypothetical protein